MYGDRMEKLKSAGRVENPEMCAQSATRPSAKSVLLERAENLRAEAHRLETLARELPEYLSPLAEQTLFNLVIRS